MHSQKPVPYKRVKATSRRLLIRPYKLSDFNLCQVAAAARLPAKNRFDEPIAILNQNEKSIFKERLARFQSIGENRFHFVFGVFDKKNGEFVGQVDLMTLNAQLKWANLGYNINNHLRNRGYATEAAKLALEIAFHQLQFHRVEAGMEPKNRASKKVAIKLGLDFEGRRKKFFPDNGGIDLLVFAANAIDYKG